MGVRPRSIKNSRSESESRVRVSGRAIYKVSASFRFALVNDYTSFRSCFLSFHGFVLLLHPASTLLLYAPSYCAFYPALSLREQWKTEVELSFNCIHDFSGHRRFFELSNEFVRICGQFFSKFVVEQNHFYLLSVYSIQFNFTYNTVLTFNVLTRNFIPVPQY